MSDDMTPSKNGKQNEQRFDSLTDAVLYLLRCFALKYKTPRVEYSKFLAFVERYLELYDATSQVLKTLSEQTDSSLTCQLEKICENKKCTLEYGNDAISIIFFNQYFLDIIRKRYKEIENDPQIPFPSEESLGIIIPQQLVSVINIKTDLLMMMTSSRIEEGKIIRLILPEGIKPIILTQDLLSGKMLEFAANKIKLYMDNPRNSGYIENKLTAIFQNKDLGLREMMTSVVLKPSFIIKTIHEMSDFTFRFWAHFCNLMIQEFITKDNKLPKEHDYCQAAYILSFYNIYYKGVMQKEKEKKRALDILDKKLCKPPFIFTLTDIYHIKDSNGYPIIRKISKSTINDYLQDKLTIKKDTTLPELLKFKTVDGKEYFIHKSKIVPLCIKRGLTASHELRKAYLNNWIILLKKHKKLKIMFDDGAFLKNIELQLKNHFPILFTLLDYNLLYMASKDEDDKKNEIQEIKRYFDRKTSMLRPYFEILSLDRKEILQEAKSHLPFWESIPILRLIVSFLKRLFFGKDPNTQEMTDTNVLPLHPYDSVTVPERMPMDEPANPRQDLQTEKYEIRRRSMDSRAAFDKAIIRLKHHLVGHDMSIDEKLEKLADRWNPLYDSVAKSNLVEDVNSIIRDYIRRLKYTFRVKPPDLDRIRNLAETLSENRSFEKIKNKSHFQQYIEIYMVKLLGERIKGRKRL
ncbi:MAG: hypothetical protein JW881_11485 [Spirochaetales bacterium]|nr:hypothetical protein [Spirochaetales bacterium]